jgi:redox-sensitive bicupin YhaK (pirin superfamily)
LLNGTLTHTAGIDAISLRDSATITINNTGAIIAHGDEGIYSVSTGAININGGTVSKTAGGGIAIEANNPAATVTVSGGTVSATGGDAINSAGAVTLSGGTVSATTGMAIRAAAVNVTGTATVSNNPGAANHAIVITGNNSWLWANGAAADLTVNGNVDVMGGNDSGVVAGNGGAIQITGNVVMTGAESAVEAFNGGTVNIAGNVTANANPVGWSAAYAGSTGSAITIGGNLTTSGVGANAWNDATIVVNGNVTANGDFGVESYSGGTVTIGGTLTANPYIQFWNQNTAAWYFVPKLPYPTTTIIGGNSYHVYTNAANVTTDAPAYVNIRNFAPTNTGTTSIPVLSPMGLALLALALGGMAFWRRRKV